MVARAVKPFLFTPPPGESATFPISVILSERERAEGSSHRFPAVRHGNAWILRLRAARCAQNDKPLVRCVFALDFGEFVTFACTGGGSPPLHPRSENVPNLNVGATIGRPRGKTFPFHPTSRRIRNILLLDRCLASFKEGGKASQTEIPRFCLIPAQPSAPFPLPLQPCRVLPAAGAPPAARPTGSSRSTRRTGSPAAGSGRW